MAGYKTLQDEFSERIGSDYDVDIFRVSDYQIMQDKLSSMDTVRLIRESEGHKRKKIIHNDAYITSGDISEIDSTPLGVDNVDNVPIEYDKIYPEDIGYNDNRILGINYFSAKKCPKKCLFRNKNVNNICAYCRQIQLQNQMFNDDKKILQRDLIRPTPTVQFWKQRDAPTKKDFKDVQEFVDLDEQINEEIGHYDIMNDYDKRNSGSDKYKYDDPQAMRYMYEFVNPNDVPKSMRSAESYSQYGQRYYDNNEEADGSFPFRYAYVNGKKTYHRFIPDHKLMTL